VFDGGTDVVEKQRFGYFKFQVGTGRSRFGDGARHAVDEIAVAELQRADVDGQRQVRGGWIFLPERKLPAGRGQYPLPDRQDQPAFFGNANELVRSDQAADRMSPADQRFGAEDTAGAVDLGLEVEFELTCLQGIPQFPLDGGPLFDLGLH
jgi:hypothetical protein